MPRRTKEAAEATRSAILDAAERVFSRRGVTRTSLADVAKAARVTRGAIYWHFRNKAAVFQAMLDRVTLPLDESLEAEALGDREHDPLGAVRRCMTTVLRKTAEDARAQRVFEIFFLKCEYVDEMDAARRRYIQVREHWLREMAADFRAAVRLGRLPATVNPGLAALAAHAYVDGLIHSWLMDRTRFPIGRQATRLASLFIDGLAGGATATLAKSGRGATRTSGAASGARARGARR